jgi:hypothetical protein
VQGFVSVMVWVTVLVTALLIYSRQQPQDLQ